MKLVNLIRRESPASRAATCTACGHQAHECRCSARVHSVVRISPREGLPCHCEGEKKT